MKILVVAPHMDDEVLGVGGSIVRHIHEKSEVSVCFIARRAYRHKYVKKWIDKEKKNARTAQKVLGYKSVYFLGLDDERLDANIQNIIIPLEKVVGKICPDIVYVPHRGDNNQDHAPVFRAAMVVCRNFASHQVRTILAYEVPSSTEQAAPVIENAFLPDYYVDISDYLNKKLAALKCYDREARAFPHPRSPQGVESLARWRGSQVMRNAAEAFQLIRSVH